MYGLPKDFNGNQLIGRMLQQVCFGLYQIQLHFDQRVYIGVTSSFLLSDSTASEKRIDIPDLPSVQSDLLYLLHRQIVKAFGEDAGTLAIVFDNGYTLRCLDDTPCYESYEIKIGDVSIIV